MQLPFHVGRVFSAQAEVFHRSKISLTLRISFLRASGGVSKIMNTTKFSRKFSPRKRRCFFVNNIINGMFAVFSAQAEVFPQVQLMCLLLMGFLRASGGVSSLMLRLGIDVVFSPRKRRCFRCFARIPRSVKVFSAQAEVFPDFYCRLSSQVCFLRASGGVSIFNVE